MGPLMVANVGVFQVDDAPMYGYDYTLPKIRLIFASDFVDRGPNQMNTQGMQLYLLYILTSV